MQSRTAPSAQRILKGLGLALFVLVSGRPAAASAAEPPSPIGTRPFLKAETAVYKMEHGVLEFGFTFTNPTDSVLFLDCQVPPKFALQGRNLVVTLDRAPGAVPSDTQAATGLEAYPPQRVGAHQTFQGQRRFDHILGSAEARPAFAALQLEMAVYPERSEGEGEPFVAERGWTLTAKPIPVSRRGKPAPPPVKTRIAHPLDP